MVPPGELQAWQHDPFAADIENDIMYGRGTTDMKGGVAAIITAICEFVKHNSNHQDKLSVVLTTDEEGDAEDGIQYVVSELGKNKIRYQHAIVGEPSSLEKFGDTIRVGRRGSLTGKITIQGMQGHIAYPSRFKNPIWVLANIISKINEIKFKQPTDDTEITTLQVVHVNADANADNVVPGVATATINFRFHPQDDPQDLKQLIVDICAAEELKINIAWEEPSKPYFTGRDSYIAKLISKVCESVNGFAPNASVGGGTSDGRFLIDICDEVVEFGTVGKSMHQVDEHIELSQLSALIQIYLAVLQQLFKD